MIDYFKKNLKIQVVKNNCNVFLNNGNGSQREKVKLKTPKMKFKNGITKNEKGYYFIFDIEDDNQQTEFGAIFKMFHLVLLEKLSKVYPSSEFCYFLKESQESEKLVNFYHIKSHLIQKWGKFQLEIELGNRGGSRGGGGGEKCRKISNSEEKKEIIEELIDKEFEGILELELNNVWHKNGYYGIHWVVNSISI